MSRSGWGLSICSCNKFQVVLTPLSGGHTLRTASINPDFGDEDLEVLSVCSLPWSAESRPPSSWSRPRSGQSMLLGSGCRKSRVLAKGPGCIGSSERSELDREKSPPFKEGNWPRCGPEPQSKPQPESLASGST